VSAIITFPFMSITLDSLDHLVLTVKDINATVDFYCRVLGMEVITFDEGRKALKFGKQKINLHEYGNEFEPKAHNPIPGAADLCFIIQQPVEEAINYLVECGVVVLGAGQTHLKLG
jgi:catechol 2,3-dioxygenase-like lactoylglutathione lyase family enzyme